MTEFRFGIDWNRDGIICWDACPGDALNILPKPLTYTTVDWRTTNVTSATREKVDSPYGFHAFNVQTGAGLNDGFILGQEDGTLDVNTIPIDASTTYSAAAWVKGISGYSDVSFKFIIKDQTGATVVASSGFTLTSDWQKVNISGTTGASATHIMLQVVKDNNAADVTFQAAGFMLVEGAIIPDGYNAGHISNLYDNVTARVTSADWFLGIQEPYQDVSHDSICKLVLSNADKLYSPEYENSPLYGNLASFRPVRVESNDGTIERIHWVGWTQSIEPDVNQYGTRRVKISAAGPMLFFQGVETSIEVQENKRTDEILLALLDEVLIPPPLTQITLLDIPGHCELGENTWILPEMHVVDAIDQGLTTLAYAADNWVNRSQESQHTFDVYRAISDVVAAERGRFLFDRQGRAVFWNRHHLLLTTDVAATFDNTMTDLKYTYAGLDEFKNEIRVVCHPRSISVGGNDLLWQLDEPITIYPGQSRKVGASYRDDSDNRIGGQDVQLANVTFTEGNANSCLEAGANRATITFNCEGESKAVLDTCELRGTKITDFGRMEAVAVDNESIAYYGKRALTMNLPSVDNLDYAQTIADFELGRRSTPAGKVSTLTLTSHSEAGGNQHAEQLARTLGERIRIKEAQTAHDAQYYIIGEAHKLTQGGKLFESTWYLESAEDGGGWMVIGSGKLDSGRLAY